jgi:hypothetical protein
MIRLPVAWKAPVAVLVSLVFWTFAAAPARAGECYFMVMFSCQKQDGTNPANLAHSFGTFVKLTGEGDRLDRYGIHFFTVSWLPGGDVHLWRIMPETGQNLDLAGSFAWAHNHGLTVSMWGPYQIDRTLYDRACARYAQIENGKVLYKAIDTCYPAARVTNCIHALSDIAFRKKRLRLGSPSWGDAATYFIVQSFRPWIIHPDEIHDWLLPPLGLTPYPIIRRDLDRNPTERPVLRLMQNFAHWHLLTHVKK